MTSYHKQIFPHMPEEIFDPWVDARFRSYGWNYPTGDADVFGWSRKFGKFTLRTLAQLKWSHGVYSLQDLSSSWIIGTQEIIDFATRGTITEYAKIENTKQRFWACAGFIRKNNAIPGSLVGDRTSGGIDILDGGHRLTALYYLMQQKEKVPKDIPIWIAMRP